MEYTFEFFPQYTGGQSLRTDFSFYEAKFNDYGRYGLFTFKINAPTHIKYRPERNIINDFSIRTRDWNWKYPYMELYNRYKGEILTKMPDEFIAVPCEYLILKLIFQYDIEERNHIAQILNFQFKTKEERNLYYKDKDLATRLLENKRLLYWGNMF